MIKARLYSMNTCPICQKSEECLQSIHLKFERVNILESPAYREELKVLIGEIKVPALTKKYIK